MAISLEASHFLLTADLSLRQVGMGRSSFGMRGAGNDCAHSVMVISCEPWLSLSTDAGLPRQAQTAQRASGLRRKGRRSPVYNGMKRALCSWPFLTMKNASFLQQTEGSAYGITDPTPIMCSTPGSFPKLGKPPFQATATESQRQIQLASCSCGIRPRRRRSSDYFRALVTLFQWLFLPTVKLLPPHPLFLIPSSKHQGESTFGCLRRKFMRWTRRKKEFGPSR